MTLTIPALESGAHVVFLVVGEEQGGRRPARVRRGAVDGDPGEPRALAQRHDDRDPRSGCRRTAAVAGGGHVSDQARYRQRSLWLDGALAQFTPRPQLEGDRDADVAIVGAGYTGLWTAYALTLRDPTPAGRRRRGRDGGLRRVGPQRRVRLSRDRGRGARLRPRLPERTPSFAPSAPMIDGIDWIGAVVEREGIDCGWVKAGAYRVATSAPQLERVEAGLEAKRRRGFGEDDLRFVSRRRDRGRDPDSQACSAARTRRTARASTRPRLARGLADGVRVPRRRHLRALPGDGDRARARHLRARHASRPGSSCGPPRRSRPGCRARVAAISRSPRTCSRPSRSRPRAWDEIGWASCAPIADQRYQFAYAQRTPDGRIALGGRGLTYRLGGAIRESDEVQATRSTSKLEQTLRQLFPAAAAVPVSHRWGCFFAAPRDWSMSSRLRPRRPACARAGGYSGHGLVASSLAGRTLADLITGTESDLTGLPWVGHASRRWEPEPLRFVAARTIAAVTASADGVEDRTGRPARRIGLVRRWLPGR